MATVSIIGTAGRGGDGNRMTRELFYSMCEKAATVLERDWAMTWDSVDLVSGGAAWAGAFCIC